MAIVPIVRYMILCEDWLVDVDNPRRLSILGLLSNISSVDEGSYPLIQPELCVFLALTEIRGVASMRIVCIFEETGQAVFGTPKRMATFRNDPLEVEVVGFRIRNCVFPRAGVYAVQFWYNHHMVEERPLLLR